MEKEGTSELHHCRKTQLMQNMAVQTKMFLDVEAREVYGSHNMGEGSKKGDGGSNPRRYQSTKPTEILRAINKIYMKSIYFHHNSAMVKSSGPMRMLLAIVNSCNLRRPTMM